MNWESVLILLLLGVVHSFCLWVVTIAVKKETGARGRTLRLIPMFIGVPSAAILVPLAVRLVTGESLIGHELWAGPIFGIAAAAGSEVVYRLGLRLLPLVIAHYRGKE